MKNILLFLMLLLLSAKVYAQDQNKVDSLQRLLTTTLHDTTRANLMIQLGREYWDSNPDKAGEYARQAITVSERIGYKKGLGGAYNILGGIADDRGNYMKALELHKKALQFRREVNDTSGMSASLGNIAIVFMHLGDINEALRYNFESLRIDEELGNKESGTYNNIGSLYNGLGNTSDALKYYLKALKINEEVGNKHWKAINLSNIASIYSGQGKTDEAMKCKQDAFAIYKEIGNKPGIAYSIIDIGNSYSTKKNYPEAIEKFLEGLAIFKELDSKIGIARSYNTLGACYTLQKKYREAAKYLDSGFTVFKGISFLEGIKNCYKLLYELDSATGDNAGAIEHLKLYYSLRDSLVNSETNKKATQQQLRYEFTKKEADAKAEQDKKDVMSHEAIKRQTQMKQVFFVGFILVLIIALILYNRFRIKKNANITLEEKNQIISAEKQRSDNLLLNILPAEVAEELKAKGTADAKHFDNVTVLFTDFISFTTVSEQLSPQELVNELHTCFKAFDEICTTYSIEKIKTIGDAYLAVCGLPQANEKHAENVVKAALEIREFMANRSKELGAKTFEIRIGINSGSVVAGIVGVKKFAYDIWGDTVNTAARMEQNSEAGKINISESTYALVKDEVTCEYRGEIDAKNKGKLKMYFVEKK
ncbi:MAG: tetratricopeptide repeat protein [Ignavibacteria bacterium]|nr:tetratricopeptide repeat protein [Ignavibacteria bacterium]